MSRFKLLIVGTLALSLALGGCGDVDEEEERADPQLVGGKADIPSWLKHIPVDWGCDATLTGKFVGFDSAHLYSFPGKVGYEHTFTFQATYPWYKGAVVAVYDSETGKRVARKRVRWDNAAKVQYKAEKSIKYLVAVYSVSIYATGSYTLSADCTTLFITCQSDASCASNEFCKFDSGCGKTGLGVCTTIPTLCTKEAMPVCGCNGKTYGNACSAAAAGVSVDYKGFCTAPSQCEQAGGYCTHFLTKCNAGYVGAAAMGCPMGKSGKCCLPAVTLTTDRKGYHVGDPINATLKNGTGDSIFLDGCSVFSWEKNVNGSWVNQGPDKLCFWEGVVIELKAGGSYDEKLDTSTEGTYRLAAAYGIGCTPGQSMSQAGCKATGVAYSAPFKAKNCKLLAMPNPNAFCPNGKMEATLDSDGICVDGYDCLPCEVADCGPALGMPNTLCDDGTTLAGPTGNCIASGWGTCSWEVIKCPE